MPVQSRDDGGTYRLRLTLANVDPPVWRLIEVPAATTLGKLHRVLQVAMGWQDYHLHLFEIDGRTYGPIDPDDPWHEHVKDERRVRLAKVAPRVGSSLAYTYDLGDGWEHSIEAEAIDARAKKTRHAVCLEGARSCPPEDCGGPWGYEGFLEAIDDPEHPDHEDLLAWIGGAFDPEAFDIGHVNRLLRSLR